MLNLLAINSAKLSSWLIKSLKMGNASSLPGRVALKFDSQILNNFQKQLAAKLGRFNSMITGTNGKTTTTGLLKKIYLDYLIQSQPMAKIISNEYGANLHYGVVTELIRNANNFAQLQTNNFCLEVDEATMPKVCQDLKPNSILVTNIFRDQLDRYGELSTTLNFIKQGIENALKANPHAALRLVFNADDPRLHELISFDNQVELFCFSLTKDSKPISVFDFDSHQSQTRSELKIKNHFKADIFKQDALSSDFVVDFGRKKQIFRLKLPGDYNVYNAVAAISNAYALGLPTEIIAESVENYSSNFGRSESIIYNAHELKTFLIKNPSGCSQVLEHLAKNILSQENSSNENLLIIINDNYADGRDVSWLWDAKFELLAQTENTQKINLICSGTRADDMALRLKYAGFSSEQITIIPEIKAALEKTTSKTGASSCVLPTYTALLDLEKIIT